MKSSIRLAAGLVFIMFMSAVSWTAPQTADPAVCLNGRTDTRLTAVFGACVEDDFRHFTLWDAPAWDRLSWTTSGNFNAAKMGWPEKEDNYSQTVLIQIDGRPIDASSVKILSVEHQFDFRRVRGQIGGLEFERVDMVVSSLQLLTGLKLRNASGKAVQLGLTLRWEGARPLALGPGPGKGEFVIEDPGGPATLVACDRPLQTSSGGGKIEGSREALLAADGEESLILTSRTGWGPISGAGRKMAVLGSFPTIPQFEAAEPAVPCDPGFRRVQVDHTHADIDYVFKVRAGGRYRIAFGLIENAFSKKGERVLDLMIEGQIAGTVDLAGSYGKNVPAVVVLEARDGDGDGALEIGVHAAKGSRAAEPLVSSIRVFEEANCPAPPEILSGGTDDRAVSFVRADRPEAPSKLAPAGIAKIRDFELDELHRLLGLAAAPPSWQDLGAVCAAKRAALYERMPRLEGFDASWLGAWSYIFDILRAGTYPAQGECLGPWMAGDLIWYRWTFYWDTALSAHTFAQWDAILAARTVVTFLKGMRENGALPIHFNPVHVMPIRPQLPNIGMALWDAYQAARDRSLIEEAYPRLTLHQRWIDQKWNRTPDGPLADTAFNIDYGTPLLEGRTIWVDMNAFQVDQYRALASMARLLDKREEADDWERRAGRLADAIRRLMWDPEKGAFMCVDGQTMKRLTIGTPVEFFTMTTGVATNEQAEKLVARVRDPGKYAPGPGHPFAIPSAPFDDPHFVIRDGWSGTIWPVQPYYTVRGLARYGYQDDAAAVARNVFGMVAAEFARTGTVWEQYRPDDGRGMHLGLFTSGITVTVSDMLLRGVFGFERTDDPQAFYLCPKPAGEGWQGITNLRLGGERRLDIRVKNEPAGTLCRIRFYGLPANVRTVAVNWIAGSRKETVSKTEIKDDEVEIRLPGRRGVRYLVRLAD